MNQIQAVIFDWAGTTVDYGCFAPVQAFITAFETTGITPTLEETRKPMGLPKREHIAVMLQEPRILQEFTQKHGHAPGKQDVDAIYNVFENALFSVLPRFADPLPQAVETANWLRKNGVAIGSTTGYTRKMMDIVAPLAAEKGYRPDALICPDDVGGSGRPAPYMVWENLRRLKITDIRRVLKVGDTVADTLEGKNAGAFTVGVLLGSSTLGLTFEETSQLKASGWLTQKLKEAKEQYEKAGADAVIESIAELPGLIQNLEERKQSA